MDPLFCFLIIKPDRKSGSMWFNMKKSKLLGTIALLLQGFLCVEIPDNIL